MDSDDLVDPGDVALQGLLAIMAERSHDVERRDTLLDHLMTIPPIANWTTDSRDALQETCQYIISLARLSRELRQLTEIDEE